MLISQIKIEGFRNYKKAVINFREKTLIIGANEVGKSNLLHALRMLLDKSLSEIDIEPQDSDFYTYEETNKFSIIIKFTDVKEDCVLAKMKEKVSDQKELYLGYIATRDPETKAKKYKIIAGFVEDKMEEIEERYYRRVINLKYISSNRDLFSYINKEKKYLLQDAKEKREKESIENDNKILLKLGKNLNSINTKIENLSFIKNATENINKELKDLSIQNEKQEVAFDAGASDISNFINNIKITTRQNNKSLTIGGDGRNNQIFMALFASRNEIKAENPLEVTIYCIEEPEAHLHPHQQRKLAEYLAEILKGQIIITTHSPQIASEYSPNSIVKIYMKENASEAANNGCSNIIEESFYKFGYRLNIIPAEAFFANVVFLVEGPSEVLLYKAISKELDIDLDRLNISILMVDGVGFDVYTKILKSLAIDFVVKTDNDISKIPKKDEDRFAGIERAINIYKKTKGTNSKINSLIKDKSKFLTGFNRNSISDKCQKIVKRFKDVLKKENIFLSNIDLENDLLNSSISEDIKNYYKETDNNEILRIMQKRKATEMYGFLQNNISCIKKLKGTIFEEPLNACKKLVELINK